MWDLFLGWLEGIQTTCLFLKYVGYECPGCGLQRSFLALLRGDIGESLKLYPALIPMILMFAYLTLHLRFRFKQGGKILRVWSLAVLGLIFVSYAVKHLPELLA